MSCSYLKTVEFPIITDLKSCSLFRISWLILNKDYLAPGYMLAKWLNQFSLKKETYTKNLSWFCGFFVCLFVFGGFCLCLEVFVCLFVCFVASYYFLWHTNTSQSTLEGQNLYRGVAYCYLILVSFTFWLLNTSIYLSLLPSSQWQNPVYPAGWVGIC